MNHPFQYTIIAASVSCPAVPMVALFGLVAAAVLELAILGGVALWMLLH